MKTLLCSVALQEHFEKYCNSKKSCTEVHNEKPSSPDYSLPPHMHTSFLVSHNLDSTLITFTTNG